MTWRTALFAAVCTIPSRLPPRGPVLPNRISFRPPSSPSSSPFCWPFAGGADCCPVATCTPCCSISKADSRSTSSSYLPYSGEWFSRPLRSSSLTGPIREQGAITIARSTTDGLPFSSRKEISASPVPSSWIACSVLKAGLARMVWAAVFTAFWSFGVKARRACCTRLPSWPSTASGISAGFCETK